MMQNCKSSTYLSAATIVLLFSGAGCADWGVAPETSESLAADPGITQRATTSGEIPDWLDTEFVSLAREIPGYGGHYFEEDGTTKVFLTSRANIPDALRRVKARLPQAFVGRTIPLNNRVEAIHAEYDFLQLTRWRLLVGEILAGEEILSIWGTDKSSNRLLVGVRDETLIEGVRRRLIDAGIPAGAMDLRPLAFESCETCLEDDGDGSGSSQPSLEDYRRPLIAGYRVITDKNYNGNQAVCTLGPVGTDPYGAPYAVVPSHCTPSFLDVDQTVDFYQPSTSYQIGWEHTDAVNVYYPGHWKCSYSVPCRHSDAALVYVGGSGVSRGEVEPAKTGTPELDNDRTTYKIHAWSSNRRYPPHPVFKIGQTTGLTSGTVVQHCFDGEWTDVEGNSVVFVCFQVTDYDSARGDSGGPVMHWYDQFSRTVILEGIQHAAVIDQNTGQKYAVYSTAQSGFDLDVYGGGWSWCYGGNC